MNPGRIHVVGVAQRPDEALHVRGLEFRHDIHVDAGPGHPVGRAGNRTADEVTDAEIAESREHRLQGGQQVIGAHEDERPRRRARTARAVSAP